MDELIRKILYLGFIVFYDILIYEGKNDREGSLWVR